MLKGYYEYILRFRRSPDGINKGLLPEDRRNSLKAWDDPGVTATANCFLFAANCFHQDALSLETGMYRVAIPFPGAKGGKPLGEATVEGMREAMIADECIYVPEGNSVELNVPDGFYPVQAYLRPSTILMPDDYHYYRFFKDRYYQKGGMHGRVTDKDKHGNLIRDPAMIKDERFPIFAGTFLIPAGGIALGPMIERIPTVKEHINRLVMRWNDLVRSCRKKGTSYLTPARFLPRALRPAVSRATLRSGNSGHPRFSSGGDHPGF